MDDIGGGGFVVEEDKGGSSLGRKKEDEDDVSCEESIPNFERSRERVILGKSFRGGIDRRFDGRTRIGAQGCFSVRGSSKTVTDETSGDGLRSKSWDILG